MSFRLYVLEIWSPDGHRFSLEQRASRTPQGAETWAKERANHEALGAPRWAWHDELVCDEDGVRFVDANRPFEVDHVVIVPEEKVGLP